MTPVTNKQERGFTIIELLIATTVLSVILLMVTVMMTNVGRLYYKGINQSRIQNNVRSISDDVSKHLQLNDTDPVPGIISVPGIRAWCIGNTRYSYVIGKQIGNDPSPPLRQIKHVLWRDTVKSPIPCHPVDLRDDPPTINPAQDVQPGTTGSELIAPNSRLSDFSIPTINPSTYQLSLGVVYGDQDLICNTVSPSTCNNPLEMVLPLFTFSSKRLQCKGSKVIGSQFCAKAYLESIVVRRLNP